MGKPKRGTLQKAENEGEGGVKKVFLPHALPGRSGRLLNQKFFEMGKALCETGFYKTGACIVK